MVHHKDTLSVGMILHNVSLRGRKAERDTKPLAVILRSGFATIKESGRVIGGSCRGAMFIRVFPCFL